MPAIVAARATGAAEMAMRKAVLFVVKSAGLWAGATLFAHAAAPIKNFWVKLPAAVHWFQADQLKMNQMYFNLWLPRGMSREDTHWAVWVTRVALRKPVSAEAYAKHLVSHFRKVACPSAEDLGFQKVMDRGHPTYVISYLCKQEKGKDFGSVTYERVAVKDNQGYVVHGEARVLPSDRGHVLPLRKDGLSPDKAFRARQKALQDMVMHGVTLCLAGGRGC